MSKLIKAIENQSVYSKDKSNKFGEVFTPTELIMEMLASLPDELWKDPTKTFFDPCSGFGNFPAVVITKLMDTLEQQIPDETERYKHILENQIYMAEYQKESAEFIEQTFNPTKELKLNLYVGDSLTMPEDFFDLPFNTRITRYPQHYVWGQIPEGYRPKPGKPFIKPLF